MQNRLKALLTEGKPALGSWICFTDPYSVELMADVGFDWLMVDAEHTPIDRGSLRTILMAMKGSVSTPVVRLSSNTLDHFQTALDLGAHGVVVPMVCTKSDAELAVKNCRYPPLGVRGFAPTRVSRYFQETETYAKIANDEVLLIVQIETPEAIANIDEILSIPGINGVFVGPSDLASFMNQPTKLSHPDVKAALHGLFEKLKSRGVPFGLPSWSSEECADYLKRGAQLMTIGSDLNYLKTSARASLTNMRQAL